MALGFIASQSASAANVVLNPGFETGNLLGWNTSSDPNVNWLVSSNVPHTGTYAANNGCVGTGCLAPDPNLAGGWLYQDVLTSPGNTYNLSYWFKVNDFGQAGPTELRVLWNGNLVQDDVHTFNFGDSSLPYIQYSVSGLSPAAGGFTRLEFINRNDPASSWLDDVCVSPDATCAPASAVPEPGAFALFGLGLAGMLGGRKRIVSLRG